jgi:hypothetical protein
MGTPAAERGCGAVNIFERTAGIPVYTRIERECFKVEI